MARTPRRVALRYIVAGVDDDSALEELGISVAEDAGDIVAPNEGRWPLLRAQLDTATTRAGAAIVIISAPEMVRRLGHLLSSV